MAAARSAGPIPDGFTLLPSDASAGEPIHLKGLAFSADRAPSGQAGYREAGRVVGPATLLIPWTRFPDHGGCLQAVVIVLGGACLGGTVLVQHRVSPLLVAAWALAIALSSALHRRQAIRITVDGDALRVQDSDMPWSREKAWPVRQIEALHCASATVTGNRGGRVTFYKVLLGFRDGRWDTLMNVPNGADAHFLRDLVQQQLDAVGPVRVAVEPASVADAEAEERRASESARSERR